MVAVGEQAPDFQLVNDAGETVRLSDFRGKKVILYFYPKALTKG
jgi:peroxiredoxin Q/BCP